MARLLTRDYERMLDLAVAILDTQSAEPPWSMVVGELSETLGCCMGILADTDRITAWAPAEIGQLPLDALLAEYAPDHVLSRHYVSTADRTPRAVTEFMSQRVWRQTGAYDSVYGLTGATHQIALPLAAPTGVLHAFLLGREGRDFSDREIAYLRRIQPLLVRADAHYSQFRRWHGGHEGAGPAAVDCTLTPREATVLSLIAEGLTSAAIARRLRIAPGTANKHREHLYRKLGTTDRLSTVLRAQALGLLPA